MGFFSKVGLFATASATKDASTQNFRDTQLSPTEPKSNDWGYQPSIHTQNNYLDYPSSQISFELHRTLAMVPVQQHASWWGNPPSARYASDTSNVENESKDTNLAKERHAAWYCIPNVPYLNQLSSYVWDMSLISSMEPQAACAPNERIRVVYRFGEYPRPMVRLLLSERMTHVLRMTQYARLSYPIEMVEKPYPRKRRKMFAGAADPPESRTGEQEDQDVNGEEGSLRAHDYWQQLGKETIEVATPYVWDKMARIGASDGPERNMRCLGVS